MSTTGNTDQIYRSALWDLVTAIDRGAPAGVHAELSRARQVLDSGRVATREEPDRIGTVEVVIGEHLGRIQYVERQTKLLWEHVAILVSKSEVTQSQKKKKAKPAKVRKRRSR